MLKQKVIDKQMIYVTGLPHAGANFLCQLLGNHPEIDGTGFTSPLYEGLTQLRTTFSQHRTFQAQSGKEFDRDYLRLQNALRGLLNGWFADRNTTWAIDCNEAWLSQLELVQCVDPNFKMLVCVRELSQICGSLEAQHQKTLLLDYPEPLAHLSRGDRAKTWFEPTGIVGDPLKAIEGLQDLDEEIQQHLYYVVFEHLMSEPVEALQGIFDWLELPTVLLNSQQIQIALHQHHNTIHFKYLDPFIPFGTTGLSPCYELSQRFEIALKQNFRWFYETFYPGHLIS